MDNQHLVAGPSSFNIYKLRLLVVSCRFGNTAPRNINIFLMVVLPVNADKSIKVTAESYIQNKVGQCNSYSTATVGTSQCINQQPEIR